MVGSLLLAVTWPSVAAQQRGQVEVSFDMRPMVCTRAPLRVENLGLRTGEVYATVIDAVPELTCWVRVHVENRGRLPATVRRLELPGTVPGPARASVRTGCVTARRAARTEDPPGAPAVDAVYHLERALAPAERTVLQLRLAVQPDGCLSPDTILPDAPVVEVSVLGLRGTRSPVGIAFTQRGSEAARHRGVELRRALTGTRWPGRGRVHDGSRARPERCATGRPRRTADRQPRWTASPAIQVPATSTACSSSAARVARSPSRSARSARWPTASTPASASSPAW